MSQPRSDSPQPGSKPRRWVVPAVLAAAAFGAVWWVLGWLAAMFGYQSNDANLPTVLVISALVFAALLAALSSAAGQRTLKRLRRRRER